MMAIIHTLAGGAIASATKTGASKKGGRVWPVVITFLLALGSHLPLDFLQHVHFGESVNDVAVSLILATFMLFISKEPYIVAAGIFGAELPDIIDQAPRVAYVFFGHTPNRPPLLHWSRLDSAWSVRLSPGAVSAALVVAFGLFFAYRNWSARRHAGLER